jgi:hypothetical protein
MAPFTFSCLSCFSELAAAAGGRVQAAAAFDNCLRGHVYSSETAISESSCATAGLIILIGGTCNINNSKVRSQ